MNNQFIKRIGLSILLIMALAASVWGYRYYYFYRGYLRYIYYYVFVSDKYVEPEPNLLRDYPENKKGKYQFDPHTILASLEQGETNVFTPISLDNSLEVEYPDVVWTQADFLQVADALSQQVWREPLDLNRWSIAHISFEEDCDKKFRRFTGFDITYFKTVKTGWEIHYLARTISLSPLFGGARWAGDGEFSAPALLGWNSIAFPQFQVTAEEAVRLAAENGVWTAEVSIDGCRVYAMGAERFYSNHGNDWYVRYLQPKKALSAYVNPFTGEVYSK